MLNFKLPLCTTYRQERRSGGDQRLTSNHARPIEKEGGLSEN
jgi:hypothetical protein